MFGKKPKASEFNPEEWARIITEKMARMSETDKWNRYLAENFTQVRLLCRRKSFYPGTNPHFTCIAYIKNDDPMYVSGSGDPPEVIGVVRMKDGREVPY